MDKEVHAFTLRISSQLKEMLETRRKLTHRTLNNECIALIETALQASVDRDLALKQDYAVLALTPLSKEG